MRAIRIGEIASASGVPTKTLRYWEDEGLLPAPERTPSGYRNYRPEIVDRLAFVRRAQTAGFTLSQIREVLEVSDSGEPPCDHVSRLVADRLADVEARIAELTATRRHLQALARRAATQDPKECEGYCGIITG